MRIYIRGFDYSHSVEAGSLGSTSLALEISMHPGVGPDAVTMVIGCIVGYTARPFVSGPARWVRGLFRAG